MINTEILHLEISNFYIHEVSDEVDSNAPSPTISDEMRYEEFLKEGLIKNKYGQVVVKKDEVEYKTDILENYCMLDVDMNSKNNGMQQININQIAFDHSSEESDHKKKVERVEREKFLIGNKYVEGDNIEVSSIEDGSICEDIGKNIEEKLNEVELIDGGQLYELNLTIASYKGYEWKIEESLSEGELIDDDQLYELNLTIGNYKGYEWKIGCEEQVSQENFSNFDIDNLNEESKYNYKDCLYAINTDSSQQKYIFDSCNSLIDKGFLEDCECLNITNNSRCKFQAEKGCFHGQNMEIVNILDLLTEDKVRCDDSFNINEYPGSFIDQIREVDSIVCNGVNIGGSFNFGEVEVLKGGNVLTSDMYSSCKSYNKNSDIRSVEEVKVEKDLVLDIDVNMLQDLLKIDNVEDISHVKVEIGALDFQGYMNVSDVDAMNSLYMYDENSIFTYQEKCRALYSSCEQLEGSNKVNTQNNLQSIDSVMFYNEGIESVIKREKQLILQGIDGVAVVGEVNAENSGVFDQEKQAGQVELDDYHCDDGKQKKEDVVDQKKEGEFDKKKGVEDNSSLWGKIFNFFKMIFCYIFSFFALIFDCIFYFFKTFIKE